MEPYQVGGISLFRESLSSDIDKCTSDSIIPVFPKFFFMFLYIIGSIFFTCSCSKRCAMLSNDSSLKVLHDIISI